LAEQQPSSYPSRIPVAQYFLYFDPGSNILATNPDAKKEFRNPSRRFKPSFLSPSASASHKYFFKASRLFPGSI
jgi:hypothetical protein